MKAVETIPNDEQKMLRKPYNGKRTILPKGFQSVQIVKLYIKIIMEPIGKFIYDTTLGYINSLQLKNIIDDIYTSIFKVYEDIKDCSITSAKQAIESAYRSPGIKKEEVLNAISYLRFAYNVSEKALDKKRIVSSFFGLITDEENIVPWNYRKTYLESLYGLCDLITILYNDIDEYNSAEIWIEYSSIQYRKYVEEFVFISPEEVEKTHPEYVCRATATSESVEETNHITGDCITITRTYDYLDFLPEGKKYVQQIKEKMIKKHIDDLMSIRILW